MYRSFRNIITESQKYSPFQFTDCVEMYPSSTHLFNPPLAGGWGGGRITPPSEPSQ